jgi:osmotically-inducible protein OsmY
MNAVNATEIGVAVKDGVVTLSGYVHCFPEKWAAERAVKRVLGVKAVAEEIKVILPGSAERTDVDIARAAETALEWNTIVPHDRVKVMVEDGKITLEGKVDSYPQKVAAHDALHYLTGVKGVDNRITVQPTAKPGEVKIDIEKALMRYAQLDARRIRVESLDDQVILHGSVRSWAERQEAEDAAWAAPGIAKVTNNITIT